MKNCFRRGADQSEDTCGQSAEHVHIFKKLTLALDLDKFLNYMLTYKPGSPI